MNRAIIVRGLLLGGAIVAVGGLWYWNRGPERFPEVSEQLAVAARSHNSTVDLSAHTKFAWTDVYVVPPYSTKSDAKARMDASWPWRWNMIQYRDGYSLLVFVDSSRITGIVEHPRNQGDFFTRDGIQHFTRANAVFAVALKDDSWVQFRPVSRGSR